MLERRKRYRPNLRRRGPSPVWVAVKLLVGVGLAYVLAVLMFA